MSEVPNLDKNDVRRAEIDVSWTKNNFGGTEKHAKRTRNGREMISD